MPRHRVTVAALHLVLAGAAATVVVASEGGGLAPHGASDAWLVHVPRALALPGRLSWECMALGGFPNQGKFREPQGA